MDLQPESRPPGVHRPPPWAVVATFGGFSLGLIGLLANLDALRGSWGLRAVAIVLACLAVTGSIWVWRSSQPGRSRALLTAASVVLALTLGVLAVLAPGRPGIPRYDARLETRDDATKFMQWLYAHYEQEIYLKVEFDPAVLTNNADPQEMTRPRRVAIVSDVCGSATLGSGQLTTYPCVDSDVVLGVFPYRDEPDSVDLSWAGGGVGAWTLRGTFIPNQAQGPQMGTWFVGLEERLTEVPPR